MKKTLRFLRRDQRGFTLIELAVTIFVISILIAITLPNLRGTGDRAQKVTCEGNQRLIRAQLETYYLTEHGYPNGLTDTDRLQQLVTQGYLQTLPSCPLGGTYHITLSPDKSSATVDCSKHGALGL
ncbi:prepilin-type N-terminal cleavage/methylation domain-containing protein [Tumebacillus sp. ITR2]|uniref:Prepilin-type N-terminal cleavage/methylation domain-containing protein n=1 Tax=Tumebacillus amylolyticus TaxID=2801339 RepID=A0ABS1JAG8_9BACL|nr:prepilin-type N-terminal cleavage/methylation domain-containing protein [Tumebacillus amylolyticus]MBL0387034.1 prepilin-type N-terminal cleavage/methylation domain-containing protein [Tumebacillus amylolyticus]